MIISISGMPGSGKSSVGALVARRLGYNFYSAGDVRRKIADKKGMTLEEYNQLGESDFSTDKDIDEYITKLGKTENNFVIDSRLAFHFIPSSLKIFLDCNSRVSAERILKENRKGEAFRSVQEAEEAIKKRVESDKLRYEKYYDLDAYDQKNYDHVIDTTSSQMGPVIEKIISLAAKEIEKEKKQNKVATKK